MIKQFVDRFRRVKIRDILDVWKLILALLIMPFYRMKHKDLWIICEDRHEARDNGYWFFKYVRDNHKEQDCVYAIDYDSPDFEKVRVLGNVVRFGSLKHWIQYLASSKKISSQKAGNPNAAIFYFLEVYGLLKNKRIFLQHGVIKDDLKWLYYDVTKMKRFICGAYPEYEFVRDTYGYPKGSIKYTGLCRFDGLHDFKAERQVLIMPTWREWIADEDWRLLKYEGTTDISKTNYFRQWISFISDDQIKELSIKYQVKFIFYPHRNMQKYISYFPKSNEYITIAKTEDFDVQNLLKTSSMMITDYSSVFFDVIYMKKPIVYYQFDYEQFRKGQYGEGYFDYKNNPFGKSFDNKNSVFDEIRTILENDFNVSDNYCKEHQLFFPCYDMNNCKRVYDVVKEV